MLWRRYCKARVVFVFTVPHNHFGHFWWFFDKVYQHPQVTNKHSMRDQIPHTFLENFLDAPIGFLCHRSSLLRSLNLRWREFGHGFGLLRISAIENAVIVGACSCVRDSSDLNCCWMTVMMRCMVYTIGKVESCGFMFFDDFLIVMDKRLGTDRPPVAEKKCLWKQGHLVMVQLKS